MRLWGLSSLALLAACSEAPIGNALAETGTPEGPSVINTEAGRYRVELNPRLDPKSLPQNADLKMLDGDITQYAVKLCSLDFKNKQRPDRCLVFVQPDMAGLLIGYATLQQGAEVGISTEVATDPARTGLGCFVEGVLENADFEHPDAKLDISKTFESRLPYLAWQKSPGDWMVSTSEESDYPVGGTWYVRRQNDKLRVSQERWSYCYRDSKVFIDEVFTQAISLTRVGD